MSDQIEPTPLTAAGYNDGANKGFWRVQWRDRLGQFAEMGRGLLAKIRDDLGNITDKNGVFVGGSPDRPGYGFMLVKEDDGTYNVYEVASANGEQFEARLSKDVLERQGIKDVDVTSVEERQDADIQTLDDMNVRPATKAEIKSATEVPTEAQKKIIKEEREKSPLAKLPAGVESRDPEATKKALKDAGIDLAEKAGTTPTKKAPAKKKGAFADAPESGTTKTGKRSRVQNSKELAEAPVGTVIHRFNGNGTFDDEAFGTVGESLIGTPSYWDSIVKGEDKKWRRISPKTGNPVGSPLDSRELGREANDSYGSNMVFDTPDDGSTPETMYAQAEKGRADVEAERAARDASKLRLSPNATAKKRIENALNKAAMGEKVDLDEVINAPIDLDFDDLEFEEDEPTPEPVKPEPTPKPVVEPKPEPIKPEPVVEPEPELKTGKAFTAPEGDEVVLVKNEKEPTYSYNENLDAGNVKKVLTDAGFDTRTDIPGKDNRLSSPPVVQNSKDFGATTGKVKISKGKNNKTFTTPADPIYSVSLTGPLNTEVVDAVNQGKAEKLKADLAELGLSLEIQSRGEGPLSQQTAVIYDKNSRAKDLPEPTPEPTPKPTPEKKKVEQAKEPTEPADKDELAREKEQASKPESKKTPLSELDSIATPESYTEDFGFTPSDEQTRALNAIVSGKQTSVEALAGSGKTTTLVGAAKALFRIKPNARILSLQFNAANAADAKRRMPSNTLAKTTDALGRQFLADSGNSAQLKRYRSKDRWHLSSAKDVAKHLGFEDTPVYGENFRPDQVTGIIRRAVTKFSNSADETIQEKHFDLSKFVPEGKDAAELAFPPNLLAYANKFWADINDEPVYDKATKSYSGGKLRIDPNHATKMWALSNPDFSKYEVDGKPISVVFFDEAQDTNAVMVDLINKQKNVQIVMVGDPNQAIYGWRGAKNALEGFSKGVAEAVVPLTTTRRFGKNLTGKGNAFLNLLGAPTRVRSEKDGGTIVTDPSTIPDGPNKAHIVRSNAGGLDAIEKYLEEGKTVAVTKNFYDDLNSALSHIEWLKMDFADRKEKGLANGPEKPSEDFLGFNTWKDVIDSAKDDEDSKSSKWVQLLDKYDGNLEPLKSIAEKIILQRDPNEPDAADVSNLSAAEGASGTLFASTSGDLEYRVKDGFILITGNSFAMSPKYKETFKDVITGGKMTKPFAKWIKPEASKPGDSTEWKTTNRLPFSSNGDWVSLFKLSNDVDRQAYLDVIADAMRVEDRGPQVKADVLVTTAHRSKGLEWPDVIIGDDFRGPKPAKDDPERIIWPSDEELRIAYVALTRAEESIYPGSLAWADEYEGQEGLRAANKALNRPEDFGMQYYRDNKDADTVQAAEYNADDLLEFEADDIETEASTEAPGAPSKKKKGEEAPAPDEDEDLDEIKPEELVDETESELSKELTRPVARVRSTPAGDFTGDEGEYIENPDVSGDYVKVTAAEVEGDAVTLYGVDKDGNDWSKDFGPGEKVTKVSFAKTGEKAPTPEPTPTPTPEPAKAKVGKFKGRGRQLQSGDKFNDRGEEVEVVSVGAYDRATKTIDVVVKKKDGSEEETVVDTDVDMDITRPAPEGATKEKEEEKPTPEPVVEPVVEPTPEPVTPEPVTPEPTPKPVEKTLPAGSTKLAKDLAVGDTLFDKNGTKLGTIVRVRDIVKDNKRLIAVAITDDAGNSRVLGYDPEEKALVAKPKTVRKSIKPKPKAKPKAKPASSYPADNGRPVGRSGKTLEELRKRSIDAKRDPEAVVSALFEDYPDAKLMDDGGIVVRRFTKKETKGPDAGKTIKFEMIVRRTPENKFIIAVRTTDTKTNETSEFWHRDQRDSYAALAGGKRNGIEELLDNYFENDTFKNEKQARIYGGITGAIKELRKDPKARKLRTAEEHVSDILSGRERSLNPSLEQWWRQQNRAIKSFYEAFESKDSKEAGRRFGELIGGIPDNDEARAAAKQILSDSVKKMYPTENRNKIASFLKLVNNAVDERVTERGEYMVPHVSEDGISPVEPGMIVRWTNNEGQQVVGRVVGLKKAERSKNKEFVYGDYAYVKFEGSNQQQTLNTNNMEITDGSAELTEYAPWVRNDDLKIARAKEAGFEYDPVLEAIVDKDGNIIEYLNQEDRVDPDDLDDLDQDGEDDEDEQWDTDNDEDEDGESDIEETEEETPEPEPELALERTTKNAENLAVGETLFDDSGKELGEIVSVRTAVSKKSGKRVTVVSYTDKNGKPQQLGYEAEEQVSVGSPSLKQVIARKASALGLGIKAGETSSVKTLAKNTTPDVSIRGKKEKTFRPTDEARAAKDTTVELGAAAWKEAEGKIVEELRRKNHDISSYDAIAGYIQLLDSDTDKAWSEYISSNVSVMNRDAAGAGFSEQEMADIQEKMRSEGFINADDTINVNKMLDLDSTYAGGVNFDNGLYNYMRDRDFKFEVSDRHVLAYHLSTNKEYQAKMSEQYKKNQDIYKRWEELKDTRYRFNKDSIVAHDAGTKWALQELGVTLDTIKLSDFGGLLVDKKGNPITEKSKIGRQMAEAFDRIPKNLLMQAIESLKSATDFRGDPRPRKLVAWASDSRGHFNDNAWDWVIKTSPDHTVTAYENSGASVALHEFWHLLQKINPNVRALEHAWTYDRLVEKDVNGNESMPRIMAINGRTKERGFAPKDMASHYVTKQYPRASTGNIFFNPNDQFSEVSTMLMQDLFGEHGNTSTGKGVVAVDGASGTSYKDAFFDEESGKWYSDSAKTNSLDNVTYVLGRPVSSVDKDMKAFALGTLLVLSDWSGSEGVGPGTGVQPKEKE